MRALLLCLALFPALPALAAPAPFYVWQSTLDGRFTCAQVQPGEGWVRHSGPYRDAGCRVPQGAPIRSR
jgi:hypothetical protein